MRYSDLRPSSILYKEVMRKRPPVDLFNYSLSLPDKFYEQQHDQHKIIRINNNKYNVTLWNDGIVTILDLNEKNLITLNPLEDYGGNSAKFIDTFVHEKRNIYYIVCSIKDKVKIYDILTQKFVKTLNVGWSNDYMYYYIDNDKHYLVTYGVTYGNKKINVWNALSGELIKTKTLHRNIDVDGILIDRDHNGVLCIITHNSLGDYTAFNGSTLKKIWKITDNF